MKELNKRYKLTKVIEYEQIINHCNKVAQLIEDDYKDKQLNLLCIIKGALFYFYEIFNRLERYDINIEFIRSNSFYGSLNRKDRLVIEEFNNKDFIKDKNILVLDDIIDSGATLNAIKNDLFKNGAKEVKISTLLDKKEARTTEIELDYPSICIPNIFVIGFGLDLEDKYRNLKDIYKLEEKKI